MGNIEDQKKNTKAREDKERKKPNHWHMQMGSYQRGLGEREKPQIKEPNAFLYCRSKEFKLARKGSLGER